MSQYFTGSRNFSIQNSTFNSTFNHTHHVSHKEGFQRLQEYVAHGAFHDSGERFDPPKCHPNTRIAIIKKIMDWINGLDEDIRDALVMWLYGAAGAGKSAIAQTVAEALESDNFILASFFFWRNDPQRGSANFLISTLAYQLAVKLPPTFREKLVSIIDKDPLIVTRSLEAQFKALVREPLLELLHSGFSTNNHLIVIIDGLDECDDPKVQSRIVNLAFNVLNSRDIPLKILIASRPERDISLSFDLKSSPVLARIALDDGYQSEEDIRHFLVDEFNVIKTYHPLHRYIPKSWPQTESVNALVQRSSGQFIYASTVVKYVESPGHRPTHRLEIVLGIRPTKAGDTSPFAELDALYRHILSGIEDVEMIQMIIGVLLLRPPEPYGYYYDESSVSYLETFLCLETGDLQLLTQNIRSLVSIDGETVDIIENSVRTSTIEPSVRILHASLKDYLFDQSRSKELHIDPIKMHTHYTKLCIAHITTGHQNRIVFERYFYHCPLAESDPKLLTDVLSLSLNRCCAVFEHHHLSFVDGYFKYLECLKNNWENIQVSQFVADQEVALQRIIESQLDPCLPHDHFYYLLALMLYNLTEDIWILRQNTHIWLHFDLLSLKEYFASTKSTVLFGGYLNFLMSNQSVFGEILCCSLHKWIHNPEDMFIIHSSAVLFALRYITTHFSYIVARTPRSLQYDRTRHHNIAQPRWYRKCVSPTFKLYDKNRHFRTFLEHQMGGTRYMDNSLGRILPYLTSEGLLVVGFGWALHVLPVFLEKCGYSEELVTFARHARIRRSHYHFNDANQDLTRGSKSVRNAVRSYLRRVGNGVQ